VIGGSITLSLLRDTDSSTEWSGKKSDKFDVAVQSSQKLSKAPPQAVARNEHIAAEAVTSAGASAVISLASPPSQTAVAAPKVPTLTPTSDPRQTAVAALNVPTLTSPPAALPNQVTREGIADLVKRGRELIVAGKIHDARLLLKRAADAGDASAAFALGTTYDPAELEKLGIRNSKSDIAMARAWYQKAKDLGLTEAGGILQNSGR
jgi:TPR repeat protein